MRSSIRLATAVAALALALPLATVQAAPAMGVRIEVETSFIDGGPASGGPFTATGPAVDAGLICPAGQTIDVLAKVAGYQSNQGGFSLQLVKQFTCEVGPGDFLVKLQVRLDARGDKYAWAILDGSGEAGGLHGAGTGYGAPPSGAYDILDVYDGMVTNRS